MSSVNEEFPDYKRKRVSASLNESHDVVIAMKTFARVEHANLGRLLN
jgi:hypothetical protein